MLEFIYLRDSTIPLYVGLATLRTRPVIIDPRQMAHDAPGDLIEWRNGLCGADVNGFFGHAEND